MEGLADGTMDAIATDHAPHHIDEKNVEFPAAANGLVGFETAFALAYTRLVLTGRLSLGQLVEKMRQNPARILSLPLAEGLHEGEEADLAIVDLKKTWTVTRDGLHSKSKNSPYLGMELTGKVMYTLLGDRVIVRRGALE